MLLRRAAQQETNQLRAQRAANSITAQRQRESSLIAPPLAHIEDAMQSLAVEGELAFVNDQSGFVLTLENFGDDLVEGNGFGDDVGSEQFERRDRPWSWSPAQRFCNA